MSRRLLSIFAGGAIALAAAACAAVAAPVNLGAIHGVGGNHASLVPVAHMGGGGGFHGAGFGGIHGGFGGFHGHAMMAGPRFSHAMGGPRFANRNFAFRSHFHDHGFRHHHHRFFFAGYPYIYNDYYYDDYDYGCWWSRRYHRWVCPSY